MSKLEKWSDDTTCQFVTLYKKHECLWNVTVPEYKNKVIRDRALRVIQDEMAIEGFGKNEIKNKIRSLRSTYYLEKKKIDKHKTEGIRYSLYRPSLKWFYIMQEIMCTLAKKKCNEDWTIDNLTDEQTVRTILTFGLCLAASGLTDPVYLINYQYLNIFRRILGLQKRNSYD